MYARKLREQLIIANRPSTGMEMYSERIFPFRIRKMNYRLTLTLEILNQGNVNDSLKSKFYFNLNLIPC